MPCNASCLRVVDIYGSVRADLTQLDIEEAAEC